MSEILSNIVVEQTSINFSPDNNNLNITPEAIQLNIFTGASPGAGQSLNGELLYNNTNLIDGVPNTSFASGNLTLGNVANIKITGGTNGYVLQTDGAGNLDWTAMSGNGGGNGVPGGANTQIQYNDSGAFGGASGFTFNEVSGNVAIPGSLAVTGTISGTLTTAAQPNITSVGTLTSLAVTGNISAANITANTGIFTGNGSGLSAIAGANVTGAVAFATTANAVAGANVSGTVANATFATSAGSATTAGTVTTNAQPNITSVGTLSSLAVAGNIAGGNLVSANFVAGTLTTAAQPNITSVGNLTTLTVVGTSSIQQAKEKVTTVGTGATGTINFDVLTQAILFYTANATNDFTLNIRGNSGTTLNSFMANNESTTIRFINTNGANGYYASAIQIDGANVIPNWVYPSGPPSIGLSNGKDAYDFEIIKTAANTYSVLASKTGYQ
jgi:hypothetical protein